MTKPEQEHWQPSPHRDPSISCEIQAQPITSFKCKGLQRSFRGSTVLVLTTGSTGAGGGAPQPLGILFTKQDTSIGIGFQSAQA